MSKQFFTIDTDIHSVTSPKDIEVRLAQPWRGRYAGGNRGPGSLGYWNPNGVMRGDTRLEDGRKIEADPKLLSQYFFDEYDLEYGILTPAGALHIGLGTDPDFSAAVVSAANDAVIEEWLPVDSRFRGSIVVAPNDPLLAAKEIHRVGDHPGMVQVLMASGARMPYGQRFFHPIYQAAVEHDLPVAIHPGTEGVGISGPPSAAGYPNSYLEWHTGLVGSYLAHMLSLVTEGVFNKFPTLKFALLEGGVSWLPPIMWRFDKNWKALRMTTPWLDRLPSEIISEHILLTSQPIEEPDDIKQLHQILDMFPADKMLMFSSDFPHWDGDTPDFAARLIPSHLRQRVMSETARELYKLPEPTYA
jgi:predicted TIM-barrel fold metal-dependent hydrolase